MPFQNNEFSGETELPPGLRGRNQPADQPGAVCLLCLPVYGESPIGVKRYFCQATEWGKARVVKQSEHVSAGVTVSLEPVVIFV